MSTCKRLLLSREERRRWKEQEKGRRMRMKSPAQSLRRRETGMQTMMRMETMRMRGAAIEDKRIRTHLSSLRTFSMSFGKTSMSERWADSAHSSSSDLFTAVRFLFPLFSFKPSFLSTISTHHSFLPHICKSRHHSTGFINLQHTSWHKRAVLCLIFECLSWSFK